MWTLLLACREDDPVPQVIPAPERVLEVEVALAPEDWEVLRRQERDFIEMFEGDCLAQPFASPFTEFDATVTLDRRVFEGAQVRKKGMLGSLDLLRPSLKVDLGQDKLTFNNQVEDPTWLRTCVTYEVMSELGLPAPRCALAHLVVNGEDKGLYAHVEDVERGVLPRYGLDGGDLYEGTLSDFTEAYSRTFEPETASTDSDLGVILEVQSALAASDEDFPQAIAEVVDVDQFLTHWMGEALVGHWDSYSATRNNFFVARPPGGKLVFLPWGVDSALGLDPAWQADPDTTPVATRAQLAWRMHAVPETRARMREILDGMLSRWDEDAIVAKVRELDALAAPFREGDVSAEVEGIERFVRERRGVFERHAQELDTPRPPPADAWQCVQEIGPVELQFEVPFGEGSPGEVWVTTAEGSFPGSALCGWSPYGGAFELQFEAPVLAGTLSVHSELLHDPIIAVTGISAYGVAMGTSPPAFGLLGGGEIVFETLGTEPGDLVRGRFQGAWYEPPYQGEGGPP